MSLGVRVVAIDSEHDVEDWLMRPHWRSWKRLLTFPSRHFEAEFMVEFSRCRRRGTLVLMLASFALLALEFIVSDGSSKLGDDEVVSKTVYTCRFMGLILVFTLFVSTWFHALDTEVASVLHCLVVAVAMLASNRFRIAQLWGVHELYECRQSGCADPISRENMLTLILVGCTITTVTFAAVRVSRSWVLPVVTVAMYILCNHFGLGPLKTEHVFLVTFAYTMLVSLLWTRSYALERDFRQQWLDNRRLRVEVQRQKVLYEDQQRWLDELNEQLDAMRLVHVSSVTKVNTDKPLTHGVVPRPTAPLGTPLPAAATGPNAVLVEHMRGRVADKALVQRVAARIRDPSYGMRQFFEDCVVAFPELNLFFVRRTSASSGLECHVEYQRTVGALFAVYWLLRLDGDGKFGLCFGYDEDWNLRTSAAGSASDASKKQDFFDSMDWSLLEEVTSFALGDSTERIEAMLCLTAFHDIMKVPDLTPQVSAEHAPYTGHEAGDVIHDHDLALAYVLEHYPHLVPSFSVLSASLQEVVLFTQTRMSFNHGWFVQAEGTPGAMLSSLKRSSRGTRAQTCP